MRALLSLPAGAQAAPLNYFTWSAAVDLVKSHLTAFEAKTGIKVNYSNAPWAQYRDTMVTKFVGKAPIDVLWVSDSWLPEWADAGWIAPINDYPELMKYNAATDKFCVKSMQYKGKQYGLTYYSDYMAFFYDEEMLKKAGIKAPPQTWDEVVQQSAKIKKAGLSQYPLMLSMARESWLVEFLTALVYSNGGRFTDDNGVAVMADPKRGALAGAAMGDRCRQQAQDRVAGMRRDRRAERPEGLRLGQPRFRNARPLSHPHAQRPEAVADRRPRQAVPDARRSRRLARHGGLDALPRA